jgi:release factor glutamine methyltransferase
MTYREALKWATQTLQAGGVDEAARQAQLLVSHVIGCNLASVLARPQHALTPEQERHLALLLQRSIEARIPVQYLIGTVEFYGLTLRVAPPAFIPRPETEELVALVVDGLTKCGKLPTHILDIGTGSGCIALALARSFPSSHVVGWDVSESVLEIARENARLNRIDHVNFEVVDVMGTVPSGCYDVIISNPPYVTEADYQQLAPELYHEPMHALIGGDDGLHFYRRFAKLFPALLKSHGIFAVECGAGQARQVAEILGAERTVICRDSAGIERFVVGSADASRSMLRVFSLQNVIAAP